MFGEIEESNHEEKNVLGLQFFGSLTESFYLLVENIVALD